VRYEPQEEGISSEQVRDKVLSLAEPNLKALGIGGHVSRPIGGHVVSHLLNDVAPVDDRRVRFFVTPRCCGYASAGPGGDYEVALKEIAAKPCVENPDAKMIELRLTNRRTHKTKVLQKDHGLPDSRGCPFSYRIQDVFLFDEKYVAVFIAYFKYGFEGPDMRFMVVTGTLN